MLRMVPMLAWLMALVWVEPARAQPSERPAAGERKRIVYAVKHLPAVSLAAAINEHFGEDVQAQLRVVPEQVGNTLLISAAPAAFDDVVNVLQTLDRAPPMITLEVLVVELESTPQAEGASGERPVPPKRADLFNGLTESVAELLAKVRRLETGGELDVVHRVRLAVLNNQSAFVQLGQRKPRVQGVTRGPTGTLRNVIDVNVGMIVGATPRALSDGTVVAELNFEKSQMTPRPDDVVIATSDTGDAVRQPSIVTATYKSTVQIPRNQAVVLGDLHTTGKRESQLLLIVTAQVETNQPSK